VLITLGLEASKGVASPHLLFLQNEYLTNHAMTFARYRFRSENRNSSRRIESNYAIIFAMDAAHFFFCHIHSPISLGRREVGILTCAQFPWLASLTRQLDRVHSPVGKSDSIRSDHASG
jgi:hypothetical protein